MIEQISAWLRLDAVYWILESRLVGFLTYPLQTSLWILHIKFFLKMRPSVFLIVTIIANCDANYLIQFFSHSRISKILVFLPSWDSRLPSAALRKISDSFQIDVSWWHKYAMPARQALRRRSGRGGCLLWLAAPAIVLVTAEGEAGDCGLATEVASPSQPPNLRCIPIYIAMN